MHIVFPHHTGMNEICLYVYRHVSSHLHSSLGFPGDAELVRQYSCCDSGAVVASPANQHYTQLGHMPLGAKCHLSGAGGHLLSP